ncbi:MAG: extracellular solute-binding protein, partial [Rhodothermia bacterium]
RRSEVGGRRSEVGRRRSDVGRRRSEVGGRTSEVGGRRSDVGGRTACLCVAPKAFGAETGSRGRRLGPTQSGLMVGLLILLVLASGCRSAAENPSDGRRPVSIMMMFLSTKQNDFYQWAERTYEARNPDVDIQIQVFPGSSLKDFEIKLRLMFASRQAPDIIPVSEGLAAGFARKGLLDPCPASIVDMVETNSVNELVRNSAYVDGTCFGIATDAVWQALFYNKRMFREAGLDPERPPRDWDELLDYAERLTVRNDAGSPTRVGFFIRKTGFKPGIAGKWFTFLYSAGGRPFSEDGTRTRFNDEAGRAALQFYQTILDRRIDAVGFDGDEQGFGQERIAMIIREAYLVRWLGEHYPDVEFGIAPIPAKVASISDGASYVATVNAESKNKDDAWGFIEFLMADEAYARRAALGGVMPATRSVAALPEYRDDPLIKVFLEQEVAPTNTFEGADRAIDMLGAYIERFCYGRLTLDETLERAELDINALLKRLNGKR